jgi:hypothetical protein
MDKLSVMLFKLAYLSSAIEQLLYCQTGCGALREHSTGSLQGALQPKKSDSKPGGGYGRICAGTGWSIERWPYHNPPALDFASFFAARSTNSTGDQPEEFAADIKSKIENLGKIMRDFRLTAD